MAALGLRLLVVLAAAAAAPLAGATSMKMDYLRLANVRTDPITHPNGLSGHVHSFFGVTEVAPDTTYADLRSAAGNTGNVKENKSLYWHPSIYRYDKRTRRYSLQDTSLFSVYYIWPTGDTTAFPDGLKILAGGKGYAAQSRPEAGCSEPGPCPDGDCERWNDFFPPTSCWELEMSMVMPSCWDGINLDSADHRAHMAYPKRSEADGDCPDTHPVRLPQIKLYTRIEPYLGGIHLFSDGTGDFHADYFSGWDSDFLQSVLDKCENEFMWASPTGWCEDHVTFRDAPKDPELEGDELREKLVPLQPDPAFDPSDISDLFLLAASLGFGVNLTTMGVVKILSSLWLKIFVQVKGALLMLLSVLLLGEVITSVQLVGYSVCLLGFAFYTRLKQRIALQSCARKTENGPSSDAAGGV